MTPHLNGALHNTLTHSSDRDETWKEFLVFGIAFFFLRSMFSYHYHFVGAQLSIYQKVKALSREAVYRASWEANRENKCVTFQLTSDGQSHSINQLVRSRPGLNLFAFDLRHQQQSPPGSAGWPTKICCECVVNELLTLCVIKHRRWRKWKTLARVIDCNTGSLIKFNLALIEIQFPIASTLHLRNWTKLSVRSRKLPIARTHFRLVLCNFIVVWLRHRMPSVRLSRAR